MAYSIIYVFITLGLTGVQVVRHLRARRESQVFKTAARQYGLVFAAMQLLSGILLVMEGGQGAGLVVTLVAIAIQVPLVMMHVTIGLRDATRLGIGGSILSNGIQSQVVYDGDFLPVNDIHLGSSPLLWKKEYDPRGSSGEEAFEPHPYRYLIHKFKWSEVKRALMVGAGGAAVWMAYTVVLFQVTSPSHSAFVKGMTDQLVYDASDPFFMAGTLLTVLRASLFEEVLIRISFQSLLHWWFRNKRYGAWLAIILSSIVWTFGHGGVLDPEWVKFAQIFPIGLFLGWLYQKHGAESVVLAHGFFNVVMVSLSGWLIPLG